MVIGDSYEDKMGNLTILAMISPLSFLDHIFLTMTSTLSFFDHMFLALISPLSFFDYMFLGMKFPLSFFQYLYFFAMIFYLSKRLVLDILFFAYES